MEMSGVATRDASRFFQAKAMAAVAGRVGSRQCGIWGEGFLALPRIDVAAAARSSVRNGGGGRIDVEVAARSSVSNGGGRRRSSSLLATSPSGEVFSLLASDVDKDTMVFHAPMFGKKAVDPKSVASVILGGGSGNQLLPLTSNRATPAVPIGGCYRLIDIMMNNCINSGISKIFVLTQFNSASLNRHIYRTYHYENFANSGDGFVEVLAATRMPGESGEKWFQGTADAVRRFHWIFEDNKHKNIEYILVLAGDQLYRMDYMSFIQKHIDTNADITVSCVPVGHSRASDYGLVKIDKSGRITQFVEKPRGEDLEKMKEDGEYLRLSPQDAQKYPYVASMGVYVFRKETLLKLLMSRYPTCNDFGSEILPAAVQEFNVQAYIFNDYWEEIGTIRSFYDANLALTEEYPKFQFYDPTAPFYTLPQFLPPTKMDKCRIKNSIISHGCFLDNCSIDRSIVGIRSRLSSGVVLKDTVMMGATVYETEAEISDQWSANKVPIGVGQNTKIKGCIIDMNARIGKDVIISNEDGVQEADRPEEGFYIRSGIIVIPKNSTIKDGTRI